VSDDIPINPALPKAGGKQGGYGGRVYPHAGRGEEVQGILVNLVFVFFG
jgi:hypothetical protein